MNLLAEKGCQKDLFRIRVEWREYGVSLVTHPQPAEEETHLLYET